MVLGHLDSDFLERLAREGSQLSLGDGEKKTIDISCCMSR
jgi:hypothetical protein